MSDDAESRAHNAGQAAATYASECERLRTQLAQERQRREQGGQTAGWIHIDQQLPQPFVHVALCTDDRYENAPGVEENRVKAVGYLNNSFGGYWSIMGERATNLRAFPWWAPLPAAPQPEHGESDEQG